MIAAFQIVGKAAAKTDPVLFLRFAGKLCESLPTV